VNLPGISFLPASHSRHRSPGVSFLPAWVFLLVLLSSCVRESPAESEPLSHKDTTIRIGYSTPDSSGADLVFPRFRGGDSAVTHKLNDSIIRFCCAALGKPGTSIADAGKVFVDEYENYLKETRELAGEDSTISFSPMPWTLEIRAAVECIDSIICIRIDEYNYFGGAHPNSSTTFINFDIVSKTFVDVEKEIIDIDNFTSSAEAVFRSTRGLGITDDFAENGFYFPDGFVLPQAIGLTKDSAVLVYDAYEVAPYVMGPTEFTLARPKLK